MIPRSLLRRLLRLRRSPRRVYLLCAAAVCAAGLAALVIPHTLFLGFFFLPPILVAVRFCGRRAGVLLCFLAAAFWILDAWIEAGPSMPSATLSLHLLERTSLFLFITYLIDALLAGAKRSGVLLARERRSSKSKSDMLSLVSHELNNSMTMVSLAVHQLEAGGLSDAHRRKICAIIERNVSRMSSVAKNFLCEARVESGKLYMRPAPERLDRIVDEVVDALRPLADAKEIAVICSVVPPDVRAMVDRDALGVALTNLVGNAIKYTPKGGRVGVVARLGEGSPRPLIVCVEDNGIGIAPKDQDRVVAGFERAEASHKSASGFGLGLKIAHDIVKAHGGSLTIDSAPGKGARFTFELRT
ncbi:MAG: sensor histidine kinase [Elusimicrobiota bacterium]